MLTLNILGLLSAAIFASLVALTVGQNVSSVELQKSADIERKARSEASLALNVNKAAKSSSLVQLSYNGPLGNMTRLQLSPKGALR